MKKPCDFVEALDKDMSIKILSCLENPCDLAAVSGVSKLWRRFVIENGLSKQLCLKLCPEVSKFLDVVESVDEPKRDDISTVDIPLFLIRNHRAFSLLSYGLTSFLPSFQIKDAVCASSTDRYPEEKIENTLRDNEEPFLKTYWSSKGNSNHTIPETLVYNLAAELCLVSEIHVQPFQAFWEPGNPIYSADAVRFSMGHQRSPRKLKRGRFSPATRTYDDDLFAWTYTSPEYPMAQASEAQSFELPRPVLCMGGILKIELLGRTQKCYLNDLYYICVSRVQVVGRNLDPAFEIGVLDDTGSCTLKCIYGTPLGRDESNDRRG